MCHHTCHRVHDQSQDVAEGRGRSQELAQASQCAGVDVPYWMDGRGFDHIGGLYRNNDSLNLSPDERERLITEGFAANSIKVTFID